MAFSSEHAYDDTEVEPKELPRFESREEPEAVFGPFAHTDKGTLSALSALRVNQVSAVCAS